MREARHKEPPEGLQARAEQLASEGVFLGGPPRDFVSVGLQCLDVLLRAGVRPTSSVLDVGCGALRAGNWLMRILDPGRYFGIEPNHDMLAAGESLIEPELLRRASPSFAHNDDFDLSVFGEQWDYVLARSIWTHAAKEQITAMLSSFAACAAPGAALLATYHPASGILSTDPQAGRIAAILPRLPVDQLSRLLIRLPAFGANEYHGSEWVGRSHESDEKGVIRHSLRWIAQQAARSRLAVRVMPYPVVNNQYWLRVDASR